MAQDNLRKRLLKKKNIQKLNKDGQSGDKPPLPESTKTFLTVPSINDDYTSDGYSSNASNYSDITDSYPNSIYSDSENEIHSLSTTPNNKIDTTKKPTQTTIAKKYSRLHRSHKKRRHQGPKSIFAFRRVYFILGIIIGALTIYLATKKMDEYKDMPSILKNG